MHVISWLTGPSGQTGPNLADQSESLKRLRPAVANVEAARGIREPTLSVERSTGQRVSEEQLAFFKQVCSVRRFSLASV